MIDKQNQHGAKAVHLALLSVVVILLALFGKYWWQKQQVPVTHIDQKTLVSQIQNLSRLQTVAVSVDSVISASKQGSWQKLWQDEQKGLFVVRGRVLAGVDLSSISAESVQVQSKTDEQGKPLTHIIISVPPSQIFEVFLDDVQIYDWQTGLFNTVKIDPQLFAQAQNDAKMQVLQKACASDVMTLAANNAAEQIKHLFLLANVSVEVISQGNGACRL